MTTTAAPRTASGSDFAELNRRINAAGLLRRRPAYYAVRLGLVGAALVAGWSAFFVVGASWWTLAVAAFLAVVFAQVALVAHDLAHRQVFRTNRPSARAGLVAGNLAIGMSYGYWMTKHTKHHANPNHDDLDPDVGPGVLVWSRDAARGRGFLTRHQAFFFLPLLTLLGISLKRDSIKALRDGTVKRRGLEGGLLAAHFVVYLPPCSSCCRRCRRSPSSWCTRRCSASTSASPSRPTTRACRIPTAPRTSCASRC